MLPLSYGITSTSFFSVSQLTAVGTATVAASSGGSAQTFTVPVQAVAPGLFAMNGTGTGVAAATALRVQAGNPQLQSAVAVFRCAGSVCAPAPIALGIDTPVYLTLYGTGVRGRSSLNNVSVTIAGFPVPVLYAGPQPSYPGLDQVNVALTLNLRGAGVSSVVLTVDGQTSNMVLVAIQ